MSKKMNSFLQANVLKNAVFQEKTLPSRRAPQYYNDTAFLSRRLAKGDARKRDEDVTATEVNGPSVTIVSADESRPPLESLVLNDSSMTSVHSAKEPSAASGNDSAFLDRKEQQTNGKICTIYTRIVD